MECLIVLPEDIDLATNTLILRGEEAHHAAKVLRLRQGEEFLVSDTIGSCYRVVFGEARTVGKQETEVTAVIEELLPGYGESSKDIELIIGFLSQPARWEFLLEKATELGVTRITPVITERTEKRAPKLDRSERILRAALKQTKRSKLPILGELSTLSAALGSAAQEGRGVYILHEVASENDLLFQKLTSGVQKAITLVVGPEGGFSENEVQQAVSLGAGVASLGERRLRAETAAIAALAIAQSV